MGLVKSGVAMGFSGNVGNLSYSQQADGTTTVRAKPKPSSKPATVLQLACRQKTALCAAFLKPINNFIGIGFRLEGKLKGMNSYNAAAAFLRKNSITGDYPDLRIDYSKILVTKGEMEPPKNAEVSRSEFGFLFKWDNDEENRGIYYTDQIMLLAYFPALGKAAYVTAGAQRIKGIEMLTLGGIKKGYTAEVFIAFIEDNRKSISNSVHLGQLNW